MASDNASEWRTGLGWVPNNEDDETGRYLSSDDAFAELVPGDGWDGPTDDPDPVGNDSMPGWDAKAIARWDVVPYQTVSGNFEIGLLAFHMNGIERIDVSLEDGPWQSLREMHENPRTGIREYVAVIPGDTDTAISDGLVELRAIAYPEGAGTPRLLDSLFLFVNNHGTLDGPIIYVAKSGNDSTGDGSQNNPYATVRQALNVCGSGIDDYEGATIRIEEAGRYDVDQPAQPVRNTRWITIEGADGLSRDDVVIAAGSTADYVRPNTQRLRFTNVSIDFSDMYQMYKEDPHQQWYDNCRWFYGQGWTYTPPASLCPVRNVGYGGLFVTDSGSTDSIYAFINCNLVRNSHVERISGDVFQNSLMVVGCSVDTVDGTVMSHHSDLFQYFGVYDNLIVYDINAASIKSTQNFFLDHANTTFTNCAFVNISVQDVESDPPFSQLNSTQEHVLFFHVSNPGQRFVLRDDMNGAGKFVAKNVIFRNNVVERIQAAGYFDPIPAGVSIESCHFNYNAPTGDNPTVGAIEIINSSGSEFEYRGIGASQILGSALHIPGYSDSDSPDRGATSWRLPR
ncbi:MAG: hypothetical protein HND58_04255 [Planctomycetota bacterium]|nr:MAG: hypothetical protein HND58_04255 [Planctomycetota bacterium]